MNLLKIGSDHTHNINMAAILDAIFKMAAEYILNVMKWLYILTNSYIVCVRCYSVQFRWS